MPTDSFGLQHLWAALENAKRVDYYEHAATTGKHGAFFISDFGNSRQPAPAFTGFPGLHMQGLIQRNRLEIIDSHLRRGSNDIPIFVQLAHGFIKNGGDDSAMAEAGRPGVPLSQPEAANKAFVLGVRKKFQMHSVRIVFSAPEAQILFERVGFASVPD